MKPMYGRGTKPFLVCVRSVAAFLAALLALGAGTASAQFAPDGLVLESSQTRHHSWSFAEVADGTLFNPDRPGPVVGYLSGQDSSLIGFDPFDLSSGVLGDARLDVTIRIRDLASAGRSGGPGSTVYRTGEVYTDLWAGSARLLTKDVGLGILICNEQPTVCLALAADRRANDYSFDVTNYISGTDDPVFRFDYGFDSMFLFSRPPSSFPIHLVTRNIDLDATFTLSWRYNPAVPDSEFPPAPVPEPTSWAMMLAGFALSGCAVRRARRAARPA